MARPATSKPRLRAAEPAPKRPAVMTGAVVPVLGWPPDEDRVEAIFERLARVMPDPKTELNFSSPFTLVVAVALSAQATDVAVNKATDRLFAVADTPEKMLALGESGLIPFISSIGLYRGKARNVIALSRLVLEQHGGEVPMTRTALQALPGVGRKTASVVLNELGIEPAIAVDTHVFRVSHRLGLANAGTPDKVEAQLHRIVPEDWLPKAHHWLILHGRYVCTARKPKCSACVISDLCPSRAGLQALGEAI
ncbi:MAG: endonuclease III [Brevundimonas sp.]|uniref:endonuclease III n=1 Tax=Brevundimonas sp. TaxID=1871086 RepID=UPI0026263DF3|nr:endonuclease III [Brevundimonas sp.]MDI6624149.1 endonuclease III [Brevundimonas sp.]MDQ7812927.1 endonuclease III [Brevundimonas sp.]